MIKKLSIYQIIIGSIFVLSSCVNDSEDDLIEQMQTPQLITYENNIKSIIDNNCIICHANPPVNGAPYSLMEYDDVKNNVVNIINRISRQEGEAGLMPLGGPRLPQNLIDQVIQWQTDGLLEQ